MKRSILKGAAAGLAAWLIYGIVEFALSVAIPQLWWRPGAELLPWQLPLLGWLFGAYALAGILSGAAGGIWLAWSGRANLRPCYAIWACLTLVLAFILNLLPAWPLARSEDIALAIAVALAAIFSRALGSDLWRQRAAFLTNPWTVCLVLLAAPWISRNVLSSSPSWMKLGISIVAVIAIIGIAATLHRIRALRPGRTPWKAAVTAGLALAAWTAVQSPRTAAAVLASGSPAGQDRPNILLITMDTVRADHLPMYGYGRDTTPNLREFARGATVYGRAIATDGFTLPTHASIFTGMYSSWHGAATVRPEHPNGGWPLAPGTRTVTSLLRAGGYWTAEVAANYGYLGEQFGLAQGFAASDAPMAVRLSAANRPFYLREGVRKLLSQAVNTAEFSLYHLRAEDIDRRALPALEQARSRRRPFFLFLNYMDAHIPYLPPPPFNSRFSGPESGRKPVSQEDLVAEILAFNRGKSSVGDGEMRYLISQYDGGIAYMDAAIGKTLARLRETGLYENTLIMITADHGDAFGEHHSMEHAIGSVYQDQVHVPLIVKFPGQRIGQRSDALVSQVDFMPTMLEAAGVPLPPGLQGQSLRSPRTGDSAVVFSEGRAPGELQSNPAFRGVRRAVFRGSLKLIAWTAGPPELYDLSADPGELHNLFDAGSPDATALMARMSAWTASIPRQMSGPAAPADKTAIERLKSLGYAR